MTVGGGCCNSGMEGRLTFTDLEETLRQIVREEIAALVQPVSSWLNVEQAAEHLATTPDAIRGAVKRGQLAAHRSETSRLLFRREELAEFATAGDRA
jgi:excisionase family DNA binding protein